VFSKIYREKYPESYNTDLPEDVVYCGSMKLTDEVANAPLNAGKLVLSPTRTYAPIVMQIFKEVGRSAVKGMIHCSGGAQTKVLHFADNVHVVKNNLMPIPPLFDLIKKESQTDWREMFQVFNMGHRLEIYTDAKSAETMIAISQSFGVDAQIIGYVEPNTGKKLTISGSEWGEIVY
jgi:phosphoribosylformylglycinamidine cyclo-ligase